MSNHIRYFSVKRSNFDSISINKVLVNTYLLLSSTILFSAIMTFLSVKVGVKPIGFLPMIVIYFFLLFCINYFKKTIFSLFFVFALTGFLGYYVGPYVSYFLNIKNGSQILLSSLSLTGFIFLSLSSYAFLTKKNFNFLSNFLFIGSIVIIACMFFNFFFKIKLIYTVISGFFIIFSSASILYHISSVINEGETDYIDVTVSLYLSLYNIFLSLLNIFNITNND
ncbi:MAG TPA: Bax inhibitor-1 family protein [Candidatus Azoamicus sp.]